MSREEMPDEHRAQVRDRVLRARHELADAARTRDGNAVRVAVDELEEALAAARAESVPLPEPEPDAEPGPEKG